MEMSRTSRGEGLTVSFIVPAINEERHIGRCLCSIARQELSAGVGAIEVIVVDNQSTDRTAAMSRELGAQVVEVAPGFPSRARNMGVRASKGDWLVFVDADSELAPDWLTMCLLHFAGDPLVVAAAGVATPPGAKSPWVQRAWHGVAHPSQSSSAKELRWLPTFNLLVRRAAFERAGGFDESLATCEDCDLGYKLAEFGKLILEPRALAAHLGESRTLGEIFRREAWRTRGNARLALSRPFDWTNWLSLLAPLCLVLGFVTAIAGTAAAAAWGVTLWPWLGLMAAVVVAVALLVYRKTKSFNPVVLVQQCVVYSAYLVGRAAGLLCPFNRVER
jgi:glycosyltransferase involved in cell wall biosynthesis